MFTVQDRVKESSITEGNGKVIVLNDTFGGFTSFSQAVGSGNSTFYTIENNQNYETPMKKVIDQMLASRCVIGYHGAHMWIARWLGMPMIIFSKGTLTKKAFPWAMIFEYWSDFHPELIEEYIEKSVQKREEMIDEYEYWLTEPNFHRLRQQRS